MSRISCIAYTTGCLLPPSLSLFRPSTGSSHLLDTLVRPCPARSQSQYLLGSQPLSSPPAGPSAMPGTVYTSVGFKSVSTTQIKAQHSRTSVSLFYSIWCSVYWQTADEATCLPQSRHNPIPSTTVSILESCRCPLSAAEMITLLSGCDLFMLPIKLISPHIVVKAWHWKTEEDDTSSDYMAQWWHRLARVPLHRSLSYEKGRGLLYCATLWLSCNVSGLSAHAICTCPASSVLNWLRFIVKHD